MLGHVEAAVGGKAGEQHSLKIERRCGASGAHIAHGLEAEGGFRPRIGGETIGRGGASQQKASNTVGWTEALTLPGSGGADGQGTARAQAADPWRGSGAPQSYGVTPGRGYVRATSR